MIKNAKNHPHSSTETIRPLNSSNPLKKASKLSMQAISTTRVHESKAIAHRLQTEPHKLQAPVPFQEEWQQTFNRRENYLNSMFNRRKTVLQNISKRNRDIYIRISNQQSHYPLNKLLREDQSESKQKNTIENLTANSRLMLTLSRHALIQSNQLANKLLPIKDKENLIKIEDCDEKIAKRTISKQLAPILENSSQNAPQSDLKIIESRYIKDDFLNCVMKPTSGKVRHQSVGRTRLTDVYVNF